MRLVLAALALTALLALPYADARELEQIVYLHDVSGLHLTPASIYAKVGDVIKLNVENDGQSDHNLRVCGDAPSPLQSCEETWAFTPMIPPNGTAPLTFEAKRAGTFDYYCAVPGHKGRAPGAMGGMWGQLVVQGDEKPAPAAPVLFALLAVAGVALASRRLRP